MKKKRVYAMLLCMVMLFAAVPVSAAEEQAEDTAQGESAQSAALDVSAKSAILLCADTGDILYEKNPHEKMHPAPITKIMALLLVVSAIEEGQLSLDDQIAASKEAAEKGGSQIWLKEGEVMSVDDLLKAAFIGSANDATCALAEEIAGSEEAFVQMMNVRAQELGMTNTNFENCTGLDDTTENHMTTAYDIALMSMELIQYEMILDYTTTWQDSLRDGETELTNTNRLVRFYEGCTGLKTGTTSKAGSCLSATATRDDMSLVAVVLGSDTSNERFEAATTLLDYGFSNWSLYYPSVDLGQIGDVKVIGGVEKYFVPEMEGSGVYLIEKGKADQIEQEIDLPEDIQAPVEAGQTVGDINLTIDGEEIGVIRLVAPEGIEKMTFSVAFRQLFFLLIS
ncbi:MAG: D-alanyl-D-alanine carboxypeptidase [Clostridiales bacterium]|nr:D-alanyl-D-alanine carboxypeptidase [Clostridiales bacterium]